MNLLAFGIVGAVLSFNPQSLANLPVVIGLAVLVLNALIFGFWADWKQRNLNIKNFETAIKETQEAARPYFDAYDAFIPKEPLDQSLFLAQQDAYVAYLERHREMNKVPRLAKRTRLAIGEAYLHFEPLCSRSKSGFNKP